MPPASTSLIDQAPFDNLRDGRRAPLRLEEHPERLEVLEDVILPGLRRGGQVIPGLGVVVVRDEGPDCGQDMVVYVLVSWFLDIDSAGGPKLPRRCFIPLDMPGPGRLPRQAMQQWTTQPQRSWYANLSAIGYTSTQSGQTKCVREVLAVQFGQGPVAVQVCREGVHVARLAELEVRCRRPSWRGGSPSSV